MSKPILGVEIAGYGAALPATRVDNEAWIEQCGIVDSSDEKIRELCGIEYRNIADPELGETTASLAIAAGRTALAMAGPAREGEVNSLILATITPDKPSPGSSAAVLEGLGLDVAHDINAGCAGFLFGLTDAYRYLATDDERCVVIGADLLSRITDRQDRSTAILFGDGAGAVVLQKTDQEREGGAPGILSWYKRTMSDAESRDILYYDHGGYIQMRGKSVFKSVVPLVVEAAEAALDEAEVMPDDLSLIIPHQANRRILCAVAERLGIGMEKMVWTGDHHANTSSASIPLALAELHEQERLKPGDLCMPLGFGSGIEYGACVIRL